MGKLPSAVRSSGGAHGRLRYSVGLTTAPKGHVQFDEPIRQFRGSFEGMCLVTEKASEIPEPGDKVAHLTPHCHPLYTGAPNRFDDEGTKANIFVCA
jgi:hypothetical protein